MNKQELNEWLKKAKHISCMSDDYDESGNHYVTEIYEYDNCLYMISFCNDAPTEEWKGNGFIRGSYIPKKVVIKTRTIKEVYYEKVK